MISNTRLLLVITAIVLFLFSTASGAQTSGRPRPRFGVGGAWLIEKNNDGRRSQSVFPLNASVGLSFGSLRPRVEYSTNESRDGNASLSVKRERERIEFWFLKAFSTHSFLGEAELLRPGETLLTLGLAPGLVRNTIKTTVFAVSEGMQSGWEWGLAASGGLLYILSDGVSARVDLRAETAQRFELNDARWGVVTSLELTL